MLPDVDIEGQTKICAGRVAIIGLGGLGSPVAMYLAAAGVGHLTLVDDDQVDLSNLQRQVIHSEAFIDETKIASARNAIAQLNSRTETHCIAQRLDREGYEKLLADIDVVVDATDNFETRYTLNLASISTRTPLVSAAAIRMEGQLSVFDPRRDDSPCYRCLYREGSDEELNCSENGVIAPVVGILGTMQAMEVLKLLGEFGEPLVGRVIYLDAKRMEFRSLKLNRDPNCLDCQFRSGLEGLAS